MKRTPMPRRSHPMPRGTPLKARGTTKAKKEARYKAFLSSAAWKVVRRFAIERAGGRCEFTYPAAVDWMGNHMARYGTKRCPEREKLNVHHLSYARFGGKELPEDLIVLCKRCHDAHHAANPIGNHRSGLTPLSAIVPGVLEHVRAGGGDA